MSSGGTTAAATPATGEDDNSPPTTVLVVLGSLQFEPSGESDILSVKIVTPDELHPALTAAKERVKPNSLSALHIIFKASSIPLFDEKVILSTFMEALQPDGAEVTVHALANNSEMPIQPADLNEIRVSLVTAGLALESEASTGDDGGWALTARTTSN